MNYYTKQAHEQTIHIYECYPHEGILTATHENSLTPVEDIHHDYFEARDYERAVAVNCSFFSGRMQIWKEKHRWRDGLAK